MMRLVRLMISTNISTKWIDPRAVHEAGEERIVDVEAREGQPDHAHQVDPVCEHEDQRVCLTVVSLMRHRDHLPSGLGHHERLLAGLGFNHVNPATESRIEAVDDAQRLERLLRIGDRSADERLFHRTADALGVARRAVPRGRRDAPGSARSLPPLTETQWPRAPRGASHRPAPSPSVSVVSVKNFMSPPLTAPTSSVIHLPISSATYFVSRLRAATRPSSETRTSGLPATPSAVSVVSTSALTPCDAGDVRDEHAGQRTDLHRLVVEARSLDPRVLVVGLVVRELRLGLADGRVEPRGGVVPRVLDVLLDLGGSGSRRSQAADDRAARKRALLRVHALVVEDAPRQEVADALAVAGRLEVERRDGQRVRDHRVGDPVATF